MHRFAETFLPGLLPLTLAVSLAAQTPQYTTFAAGCAGSAGVTRLTPVAMPVAGGTLEVDIGPLPQGPFWFMVTGFSNTTSPFGPLPVPLAGFGMPGCSAHVSPDSTLFQIGSPYTLTIPPGPALVSQAFFQQALVLDPAAGNPLGAVMSDAASAVIGPLNIRADMVAIAPGSFSMGSNAMVGPPRNLVWEAPVHTVHITRPFWIGRFEVTQAEYQAVMNANPSAFAGGNLPVEQVRWADAVAFCRALTAQEALAGGLPTGYEYRLPTEAEWEYCCRAGTTSEYHVGASLTCAVANYWDDVLQNFCVGQTSPVGSYPPNPWGLHDMHGNVVEWCLDQWDGSANYPAGPVSDPFVNNLSTPDRVFRGGSWGHDPVPCRSAFRGRLSATFNNVGFRVVLAPRLNF